MCGRFTLTIDSEKMNLFILTKYNIQQYNNFILPRYNIAPGQEVISVINDGIQYRVGTLKWGLIPKWASDEKIGYKMINARKETIASKPMFLDSLKNKRCIILADSFYEWKKDGKSKIPMRIKMKSNNVFSMAGLYSSYIKKDGSKLYTCTIITTSANELVAPIHDRMPVILNIENEKIWLNPNISDLNFLDSLLTPFNHEEMETVEVSSIVNNPKNEFPQCIESF